MLESMSLTALVRFNTPVRERMAEQIARDIFTRSSEAFVRGEMPPRIVIYVEEAHNLIGRSADLDTTWPRLAKEGAKFGISLVYATQEPSSIHPNILANTENLFVTHLNNDGEIRALASYYDFADFAEGLKRCQDVGFARVKTLSSNFITPTQGRCAFFDRRPNSTTKEKRTAGRQRRTHERPTSSAPSARRAADP